MVDLSPIKKRIFDEVFKGNSNQKRIAAIIGRSRSVVSGHLVSMEKAGLIRGVGHTHNRYYITLEGGDTGIPEQDQSNPVKRTSQIDQSNRRQPHTANEDTSQAEETYRNHATWMESNILSLTPANLRDLASTNQAKDASWSIKNNYVLYIPDFDKTGWDVKVFTRTLQVLPPDREVPQTATLPHLIDQRLFKDGRKIMERAERVLRLNLTRREGNLEIFLVRQELALTHNAIAKDVVQRKWRIKIEHPGTERECFVLDASHPDNSTMSLDEAEGVLPSTNQDQVLKYHSLKEDLGSEGAKSMVQDLGREGVKDLVDDQIHRDKWTEMKSDVADLKEISKENTLSILESRQWFRHHDEQTVQITAQSAEVTQLIKDLREERKRDKPEGLLSKIKRWLM